MKTAALILLIAFAAHADDSDLVKAAKRKPSTTKPITNEDVKKNATKSSGAMGANPPDVVRPKSELALYEERNRARAAAGLLVKAREQRVALLEKELSAVEQSYYDAIDLDARDRVITRKFTATKARLEAARYELAEARDAEAALAPPPATIRQ